MRPQHWIYTWPLRVRSLFRRQRVERELDQELQFHIEQRIDELVAGGTLPATARTIALREIGGVEQRKEECRDARRTRPIEDLFRDLAFGLRMLRKAPGFTAVVIIALALGIGANTALFSLFHQILVRKLPVTAPEQLVVLAASNPNWGRITSFSYPTFKELRDRNSVFEGMFAYSGIELNVGDAGGSEKATGQLVSGDYFATLGVQPWIGRLLNAADDETPGAHPVAVLSHSYWQRRFGGDPAVIGTEIILNGHPITVIGVTPPGFYGTDLAANPDLRVPLIMAATFRPNAPIRLENPGHLWLRVMARLKAGVPVAEAEAALQVLHAQIREAEVGSLGSTMSERSRSYMLASRAVLLPGAQGSRQLQESLAKALQLLLGITIAILVITCANLANMLLARNAAREQEVAMRRALGASRTRLARQWLTESALLALLGGAAGVLVATWCQSMLVSFVPADQRMNLSASPDLTVLGFALLVSLGTGILFGVIPALQVSRMSLEQAQKGTRGFAAGFRSSLVGLQIALCLPLLIIAGLFLNSLRNARLVPTGFDGRNIVLASLHPSLNGYPEARVQQFFDRVLQETRALPGVEAAGLATSVVLSGESDRIGVAVEGYEPQPGENTSPYFTTVSPGYFAALRLPIVAGRDFTDADNAAAPRVGIINETMARYYFGSESAVGKRFGTDKPDEVQIIGVVQDAKYVSLKEKPERHYYFPVAQNEGLAAMTLHVRSSADPRMLIDLLRAKMREIDPNVPLFDVKTLEAEIDDSLTQDRLVTWLSAGLGLLATLLATIGLYGVIAFSVARRTREVGIRMALGAQRGDIFGLIMKRVSLLVGAGLIAGGVVAAATARLVSGILFGITPADPATFAAAGLTLLGAAAVAAYLPARRALRVNPSVALRYE